MFLLLPATTVVDGATFDAAVVGAGTAVVAVDSGAALVPVVAVPSFVDDACVAALLHAASSAPARSASTPLRVTSPTSSPASIGCPSPPDGASPPGADGEERGPSM